MEDFKMAKLIDELTGKELVIGQVVETSRGEKTILTGFKEPHKPSSTGRVYVKAEGAQYGNEYFPSVIGAKIIEHQFS
jgi:hypothetical protein